MGAGVGACLGGCEVSVCLWWMEGRIKEARAELVRLKDGGMRTATVSCPWSSQDVTGILGVAGNTKSQE